MAKAHRTHSSQHWENDLDNSDSDFHNCGVTTYNKKIWWIFISCEEFVWIWKGIPLIWPFNICILMSSGEWRLFASLPQCWCKFIFHKKVVLSANCLVFGIASKSFSEIYILWVIYMCFNELQNIVKKNEMKRNFFANHD